MREMLRSAREGGYAVGAFNIVDINSARAVVQAASELRAPAILQTSVKTVEFWGPELLVAWIRPLAETAPIPLALHLDHCRSVPFVLTCIAAGWTSVMIDASAQPFEENLASTQSVLAAAEAAGVSVEAELGEIAGVEEEVSGAEARLADPAAVETFCAAAPVAALAPAIGTAHGLYRGTPKIAFDRLAETSRRGDTPLALHGGTGLSPEVFRKCISLGCAKVNISTALKHAFIDGFVEPYVARRKYEPLPLLESQFQQVKAVVAESIEVFGSAGRAGK
jgi:fructose-bisphosphate aldolase, class II